MKTKKWKLLAYVAAILCLSIIAFFIYAIRVDAHKTIKAIISNLGPYEMENVTLRVTGNQYQLGLINEGSQAFAQVRAKGESHIEIGYDRNGKTFNLVVDRYFEAGYSGTISVEVENDKIAKITDKIQLSQY
ncbi:MAG: hypothetical protein WCS96_05710 [Victivallales bacterium]